MTRLPVAMSNGLIPPAAGKHHGELKMAASVSLLLRGGYSCGCPLTTERGEVPIEPRVGHYSGTGTWFALLLSRVAPHREGLAPALENHEEDRMKKTISALTAAAVFTVFATAFAQAPLSEEAPAQMPAPTQEMTPPPAQAPAQAPSMSEEKKADKAGKVSQGKGKGKAKGHAKKASRKLGDRRS